MNFESSFFYPQNYFVNNKKLEMFNMIKSIGKIDVCLIRVFLKNYVNLKSICGSDNHQQHFSIVKNMGNIKKNLLDYNDLKYKNNKYLNTRKTLIKV